MTLSVAMVVNRFPVRWQTFIIKQIAALMQRGVHVDIYSRYGPDELCLPLQPDVTQYGMLDRTYHQSILSVSHPANRFLRLSRKINRFVFRRRWKGLPQLGRIETGSRQGRTPYDIVHCQFGYVGLGLRDLPAFKSGLLDGRLIVSLRGNDISEYVRIRGSQVYARVFRDASVVLANCEYFRQRAIAIGCDPQKVIVHASGIDCEQFSFFPRAPRKDGRVRLLAVGRLVEKKGFEYAIRAVAKLVKDRGNIDFEIIGDGPLRADLQKLICRLGVEGSIRLVGARNAPEIVDALRRADLFVASSVASPTGDEDAPVNTLKEAMAVGVPVVATRHGGIPELVEDGVVGFLVPERSVDALAERIAQLADRPDLWPVFGRAGRQRVEERYSIHRLTDELLDTYQRCLSQPACPAA